MKTNFIYSKILASSKAIFDKKINIFLLVAILFNSLIANAQLVEEKITNPSSLGSFWTPSSSNGTSWTNVTNGTNGYTNYIRGAKTSSQSTAMTLTSPTLSNVNPIMVGTAGYFKIKFDLRIEKGSSANPQLIVQTVEGTNTTNYLTLIKTASGGTFTKNVANNAILSYGLESLPDNAFRTVTLLVPKTTAFNGSIRFSYTPNGSSNIVALRNISVTSLSTSPLPACSACTINLDETGSDINYQETTPIPECGVTQTGKKYVYYLPAIADMPEEINTAQNNVNPAAQIQITTEAGTANFTINRPTGALVTNSSVNSGSLYSYTTPLTDMLTTQYNSAYSNKGYVIESDQPITVRWRLNNLNNRMQVILRGDGALGNAFRLASVLDATDITGVNGVHYYTVMATADNTKVQIGNPAFPSSIITFTLQKGQQRTGVSNSNSVSGTLVLSDKPIVVASGQQHKRILSGSSSLEGTVLQLSPFRTLGKDFITVTTEGFSGFQVIAVQNATAVYRNGNLETVLNAGEVHQVYFRQSTDSLYGKRAARISTSKEAYVYELGSNDIGEFEMYPAPPTDKPVGKAGKITYSQQHGLDGWVIVNTSDVSKLRRNNSATLGNTSSSVISASGSLPAKTVLYWNNVFAPNAINDFTCTNCESMFVGQMNDGGSAGAQVGYISSFDIDPIQFFNTTFLPAEILTNGYIYDTIDYFTTHPTSISHTISLASSNGPVTIDSIALVRGGNSGNLNAGSVQSISNLVFNLNLPPDSTVPLGTLDTIYSTIYVVDTLGNKAALCLSYIVKNIEPLPVKIIDFTATKKESQSLLEWSTSNEYNNAGFVIQRSNNTVNWEDIGWVDAIRNTTDIQKDYSFLDKNPLNGKNFYRLKQVDNDQGFEYTKVILLVFDKKQSSIVLSPNPANSYVNISGLNGSYSLKVVNISGSIVKEIKISGNEYKLDVSDLASGTYAIRLLNESGVWENKKIVITK